MKLFRSEKETIIMNIIQQDVLEIAVYDENGVFITDLKFNKKVSLETVKAGTMTYLTVTDAVQNLDMLELLGEKVLNSKTDFEKDSFDSPEVTIIRFSEMPPRKKLKLVGTGIDYNLDTSEVEHDIKIIFPNVELIKENNLTFGAGEVQTPKYKFKVLPYDEEGNLYDMQFKKRK